MSDRIAYVVGQYRIVDDEKRDHFFDIPESRAADLAECKARLQNKDIRMVLKPARFIRRTIIEEVLE